MDNLPIFSVSVIHIVILMASRRGVGAPRVRTRGGVTRPTRTTRGRGGSSARLDSNPFYPLSQDGVQGSDVGSQSDLDRDDAFLPGLELRDSDISRSCDKRKRISTGGGSNSGNYNALDLESFQNLSTDEKLRDISETFS